MQDQYVTGSAAWFTLSLINAGLAQGKGRSGLNWWFASLLLGPLATLLIVAWPRADASGPHPVEGRMTQRQAIVLGAGILVVALLGAALFALLGR